MIKLVSTSHIKALEEELQSTRSRLYVAEDELQQERAAKEELANRLSSSEKKMKKILTGAEASGKEVIRIRKQYDLLKKEFETFRNNSMTRAEAEAEIKELKALAEQVDDMKMHYELRIKHLRHALADARALLADRDVYDAGRQLDVIDLRATPTAEIAKVEEEKIPDKSNSKNQQPVANTSPFRPEILDL